MLSLMKAIFLLHTFLKRSLKKPVLGGVGLTASDSGGKITFYGKDPIVPSRLRFGTMSAIGLAAKAVAAAAIWRFRGNEGQDIHVDVRKAFDLRYSLF
jgi:hypothetical protein